MITFIQNRYMDKVSLQAIANAGNVCRSKCCQIFKTHLRQPPVDFLSRYRLERSIALIAATDLSITEIALAYGFSGASYFSEVFREYKGCTPSVYRLITKRDSR